MTSLTQKMRDCSFPCISWARLVSDVVSPPVVWAVLAIPVALHYSETVSAGLFWALIYSLFICFIPLAYIAWMVSTGRIGDIHMKERHERMRPLLVSILSTIVVWWLLRQLDAPPAIPLLALITLMEIIVIAAITLFWQISMHMMSISGAAMATSLVFSVGWALWLVPLVVLVGAARLHLKRHTSAQIFAGTLVGTFVPALLLITVFG